MQCGLFSKRTRCPHAPFQVQCVLGGDFPATKDVTWPTCDSTNPPPCTGFLSPPAGSGISIVEELSVIAGGSVYYRCDDHPKMTTNLGMEVRVRCARDGAGGVAFEKPAGWDLLACEPAAYPDFEDTPCRCLGDVGITKAQHSEILDKVCRMDTPRVIYGTQIVPFKSRCGVTSLADIVPENRCYCTEKVDDGVGMMLLCTFVGTANNSHSHYALKKTYPSGPSWSSRATSGTRTSPTRSPSSSRPPSSSWRPPSVSNSLLPSEDFFPPNKKRNSFLPPV